MLIITALLKLQTFKCEKCKKSFSENISLKNHKCTELKKRKIVIIQIMKKNILTTENVENKCCQEEKSHYIDSSNKKKPDY